MKHPDTIAILPSSCQTTVKPIAEMSIGEYLIQRLQDYGIGDIFGIPGDYILTFYTLLEESPINVVGCTREDCAGFAADAYARIRGMGAVCVTYCVGGLSLANSIAGAYAEKSPVVVITGSPGMRERVNNPLLHHRVRDFRTQFEVFEKLCVAGTELNDPANAFREIDRVLDVAASFKRPVYIEIPRDMVRVVPGIPHEYKQVESVSDPEPLAEAVEEAAAWISSARQPVILAGVEVHRFGLQDQVLALAETTNIPIAATMLGKSVIRETHPLYIGLYEGALGHEEVTNYVEESDCVILLGTFMSDINLGIFTANLDPTGCIYATSEQLRIRHHHFHDVVLADFIQTLAQNSPVRKTEPSLPTIARNQGPFELKPEAIITTTRMIARLNEQLDEKTIVVADIGDSLFAATELLIRGQTEFLSAAYYTSMGFGTPAALGAQFARPDMRTVMIAGDGAFQMTGTELSTIVRHGFPTIVIVMDNKGYGTERFLQPGDHEYNNIQPWNYHKLPALIGGGRGYEVRTEGEFDAAITSAWADTSQMSIIQVHLALDDCSHALKRLAEKLGKKI